MGFKKIVEKGCEGCEYCVKESGKSFCLGFLSEVGMDCILCCRRVSDNFGWVKSQNPMDIFKLEPVDCKTFEF